MKLHRAAHTVYKTQYHIVWVTRYRRKILVEGVAAYLRMKLREVQNYYPDWHFTEIGIDKDHVHVHKVIPPKYSVSFAVETMKKNRGGSRNSDSVISGSLASPTPPEGGDTKERGDEENETESRGDL